MALLLLLAGIVGTADFAAAQAAGAVQGSIYTQVIRDRIGLFASAVIEVPTGLGSRLYVPGFEVGLVNNASGATVASTKTDVFGRFRFRYQPAGDYKVCWKGAGWVAGCSPEKITIKNNTTYLESIAVNPEIKKLADGTVRGAYWGRVKLADGSSPFFYEEYFAVKRTAEVTVTNLASATVYKTITTVAGEFVVVDVPAAQLRTAARVDAATAARVTTTATVSAGGAVIVTLSNSRPILVSVAAKSGGKGVREVARGVQLDVTAEVRDPDRDPLTFTWKPAPSSGRIVSTKGNRAVWRLDNASGHQTLYVLVSDGKGGYSTQSVTMKVTDGDVTFAGKVVTQAGVPIAKPTVTVNGKSTTGDVSGAFLAKAPRADRYVVNVYSPGFVPASRIFDQSGVYNEYRLVRATVTLIDPMTRVQITDKRTEGKKTVLRPATIRLDPGSLVGRDGKAATGLIQARIATIDITNAEMPGDFGSRSGTREGNLLSYGAVFAEFLDTAGNRYNIAPGKTAEIVLPSPATLKDPPKTISLWSYNEQTGYWDDLKIKATFDPARKAYVGKVPQFSVINTDIEKVSGSCVRILLDNIDKNQVKARVTYDSGGTPFAQTYDGVLEDSLNAVRRLPENTNIKIAVLDKTNDIPIANAQLLDANQQVLPNNVVNTGPATQPLFPTTPYETCVTTSIRLNVPFGNIISHIPFLSFKGEGSEPFALGYYQALDPGLSWDAGTATWSGGTRATLGAWWNQAGFDQNTGVGGVRASYLNFNDLGFGRDMRVRQGANDTVYAYVTNYGKADQNPTTADDAANYVPGTPPPAAQGATVAMEYTPLTVTDSSVNPPVTKVVKVVKFFVFNSGQAGGKLINSADLDGFGQKFVPNLCTTCHGGEFYSPANPAAPTALEASLLPSFNATVGASFREFDTDSFKYPGNLNTLPAGLRQTFFDLNQLVKGSNPQPAIIELIDGWYSNSNFQPPNPPNSAFTPEGWDINAQPQIKLLYQQVVGTSCRTCHVAFDRTSPVSGVNWTHYAQCQLKRSTVEDYVCGNNKFMPHALMTYRNFWLLAGPYRPDVLGNFSAADWVAFAGGCL